MRIEGEWRLCDDEVTRPLLLAELRAGDGSWLPVDLLVDSGVDRTAVSADVVAELRLATTLGSEALAGLGGRLPSAAFESEIRMRQRGDADVRFRGAFSAVLVPTALDMSVLGRDITNLLALIVDRPARTVCLLSHGEVYVA